MKRLPLLMLTTALIVAAAPHARADELMFDEPPATGQAGPSINPLAPSPAAHSIIATSPEEQPGSIVARDVGEIPAGAPAIAPETPAILPATIASAPADQRPLGNDKPPIMAPDSGYDPVLNLSENDARAQFAAMDKDHDGVVTYEEFARTYAWYYPLNDDPTQMPKRYDALGGDAEGHLSLKTFIANRNKPYDDDLTMRYVPDGPRGDD